MSAFSVIAKKEIVDNLRDRRALTTALITPMLGPLSLVAVFFAVQQAEQKTHAPHVPVIGRDNAPALVEFLESQGVIIDAPPADPEAAIRTSKSDVVLRIPSQFGAQLRGGTPALVEVICDPSRQDAQPTLSHVEKLVEGYGRAVGSLRLLVRGVDPQITQAVKSERVDVSAPSAKAALLLMSLPLFLLVCCFVGGLYVAIDVTAGERERGSLEPLLLNPVPPSTIVLAKTAAAVLFAVLGMLVSLAAFATVVRAIPFAEVGVDLHLPARSIALYALLFLPTTFVAASLEILVATLSKSTKTAQASLGLIMLVPLVPAIVLAIFPQQPSFALCVVPALGESILGLRILRGDDIEPIYWIANAAGDVVLAIAFVVASAKLFGSRMLSS